MEQKPNILGMTKRYLWTSQELLDPEVGAVEIGLLEAGKYKELKEKMIKEAGEKGINKPLLVVDLIYSEGKKSQLGSSGQPYPISEDEWETFVKQAPEFCGVKVPKVYFVDGEKYTAPI